MKGVFMKNYRLHNVMFPIWMLIFFPAMWLYVIPANFVIDSAVILLAAHFAIHRPVKEIWKKSILKVFVLGFLSDFVGAAFLFCGLYISGYLDFGTFFEDACNGPQSIGGFFVLLLAVAISGICIYFADYKISFGKLEIEDPEKKKLALIMALATAPYTFFVPLYW